MKCNKYTYKVKCPHCKDTMETKKAREFVICKCGKSGFDSGDGIYLRYIGDIEILQGPGSERYDEKK